jgi:hypothetical protein
MKFISLTNIAGKLPVVGQIDRIEYVAGRKKVGQFGFPVQLQFRTYNITKY